MQSHFTLQTVLSKALRFCHVPPYWLGTVVLCFPPGGRVGYSLWAANIWRGGSWRRWGRGSSSPWEYLGRWRPASSRYNGRFWSGMLPAMAKVISSSHLFSRKVKSAVTYGGTQVINSNSAVQDLRKKRLQCWPIRSWQLYQRCSREIYRLQLKKYITK